MTSNEPIIDTISEYIIPPMSAITLELKMNQYIKVIDVHGKQVADFTALNYSNSDEILSMGATIDANNSVNLNLSDRVYSNYYNPMLTVVEDKVGVHDMIHPMCRSEMFASQYGISNSHASCFDNIKKSLASNGILLNELPSPLNIFMNTKIFSDGQISVDEPLSRAGDYILFQAKMDLTIAIAACAVKESKCNGYDCGPIEIQIWDLT